VSHHYYYGRTYDCSFDASIRRIGISGTHQSNEGRPTNTSHHGRRPASTHPNPERWDLLLHDRGDTDAADYSQFSWHRPSGGITCTGNTELLSFAVGLMADALMGLNETVAHGCDPKCKTNNRCQRDPNGWTEKGCTAGRSRGHFESDIARSFFGPQAGHYHAFCRRLHLVPLRHKDADVTASSSIAKSSSQRGRKIRSGGGRIRTTGASRCAFGRFWLFKFDLLLQRMWGSTINANSSR
jgi:hypothetical protein